MKVTDISLPPPYSCPIAALVSVQSAIATTRNCIIACIVHTTCFYKKHDVMLGFSTSSVSNLARLSATITEGIFYSSAPDQRRLDIYFAHMILRPRNYILSTYFGKVQVHIGIEHAQAVK